MEPLELVQRRDRGVVISTQDVGYGIRLLPLWVVGRLLEVFVDLILGSAQVAIPLLTASPRVVGSCWTAAYDAPGIRRPICRSAL